MVIVWFFIVAELLAAVIVFIPTLLKRTFKPILAMVTLFFVVAILSVTENQDCGCFGELPFLSALSPFAHIMLLVGLFIGIYTLGIQALHTAHAPKSNSEWLDWLGIISLSIIIGVFFTLPFNQNTVTLTYAKDSEVDISQVESAIEDSAIVIIDARPEFQYEFGHIPGAINIPYNSRTIPEIIDNESLRKKPLIVYCSSALCGAAGKLAQEMRRLGCEDVKVYAGGWQEWQETRINKSMNFSSQNDIKVTK